MMRSELYNMFPGADTIVLDEIFESNKWVISICVLPFFKFFIYKLNEYNEIVFH